MIQTSTNQMPADDPGAPPAIDTTVELLVRARRGDKDALEQLFGRHIPLLRRWASGRLPRWARDIADTPDLVQETALQTFKHLDTFEPRGDGALRPISAGARQPGPKRAEARVGRPAPIELDSGVADEGTSPYEAALAQQTVEHYEAGLARLKPEEREAIISRVEFGLTYAEVAEVLGNPLPMPPAWRSCGRW